MERKRWLDAANLSPDERLCLDAVFAATESTGNFEEKREMFRSISKKIPVRCARQKLLEELAREVCKESLVNQIGALLFVRMDAELSGWVLRPEKSLKECCSYLMEQARAMARDAKAQALCVKDDLVFHWAEQYYRLQQPSGAGKSPERHRKKQSGRSRTKNGQGDGQMSLFDLKNAVERKEE